MFITVIGGGNSTTIFATECKLAGHKVAVLTRKPDQWAADKVIGFKNEDETYLDGKEEFSAEVDVITSDPAECIPQSDMVFISGVPIHFNEEILKKIKAHLQLERETPVYIGSICAYGGFNWLAAKVLGKGNYFLFGTRAIPWTCGTLKYGSLGVVFGQKVNLRICTEVVDSSSEEQKKLETSLIENLKDILHMERVHRASFLVGTMWPNNPSVHPPILYGLFKNWSPKDTHQAFLLGSSQAPEYIYKEISSQSAINIDILNKEVMGIIQKIPDSILREDKSGADYMNSLIFSYGEEGVLDKTTIQSSIQTTKAYLKHKNPYVLDNVDPLGNKYVVPNVEHKFFTTDLSYGLCTYKDIALMKGVEVETPLMDKIIYWNQSLIDKEYMVEGKLVGKDIEECILPSKFGLSLESLGQGLRRV